MKTNPSLLLEECFRWFGPKDPVPLHYIRHAGASAVFSSLHHIPYGELWPRQEIRTHLDAIQAAGLRWTAVESVPVHEDIKTGSGDLKTLFSNYAHTLRNLAAEGITTVVYNFMPVLDWVRTDMRHVLPDGTECLLYDPVKFAAFEIHAVHLRATKREPSGVFYEADHLDGDVDMPALLAILLGEQDRRRAQGRSDWRLPLRPDHGHVMMQDLDHYVPLTPGYSPIRRMRGLAELRGVMHGIAACRAGRSSAKARHPDFP